jgi:putative Mg2+ transporter-C (MgtC) family protein
VLAALTTGAFFLVSLGFPAITRRLPLSATAVSALRVRYPDGRGLLRDVLREAAERGFAIDDVSTEAVGYRLRAGARPESDGEPGTVEVTLHVHGKNSVSELAAALSDLDYVDAVLATDANAIDE